jgi:osmotically-inducible protein OsmY
MARSSEQIKMDVVESLFWDDRVDASGVAVRVSDGCVTLTGTVPSFLARQAAIDDALVIKGVKRVDSQLAVQYAKTTPQPSDSELQSNARNTLKWSPDIDAENINVTARHGVVTLKGTIDAYWKKIRAAATVQGLTGVLGVEDKLAIVPRQTFVDKSIARDIIAAMERSSQLDAETVDVTVDNGVVTLSGTVPTWAARQAAYEAALYTPGVKDVENRMTIAV